MDHNRRSTPTDRHPDGSRSAPSSRRRPRSRALAAAGVIVAVALSVGACGGGYGAVSSATTTSVAVTLGANSGKGGGLPGVGDPQIYWTTVQQQLAAGLHTSVAALTRLWGTTRVTGPKGQGRSAATTILDVADEQGISESHLRSLELSAIQRACDVLEHGHHLSASRANGRMRTIRGWNQSDLDGYAMYSFQQHRS
jgi:hypothetical protein